MIQHSAKSLIEKFIYSCSHDLRGPVATIQGLVQLAEVYPQQIDSGSCLKMIGECSEKLDRLIRSLQEYMEIESLNVALDDVELEEVVDTVTEAFRPELVEMQISVASEVNGVRCKSDSHYLGEVLKKVVANAINFKSPNRKSRIRIAAGRSGQEVLLQVSDNGMGIAHEFQSRVFDVFYKAHDLSKGPGMGLFLARKLVGKLKGTIDLHSHVGIGTSVMIRLPAIS